jgi:hypothetical protein
MESGADDRRRDVDLDRLDEQHVRGSVVPLEDLTSDAYDRVVHYSDPAEGATH